MEFFGSDSDEEGVDNHAIDQLLAACMRLVPPLAGRRPAGGQSAAGGKPAGTGVLPDTCTFTCAALAFCFHAQLNACCRVLPV